MREMRWVLLAAIVLLAAGTAMAGTQPFTVIGAEKYEQFSINNGGAGVGNPYSGAVNGGRFRGVFNNTGLAVRMFCVDARHYDGSPFQTVDVINIPLVSDAPTAFDAAAGFYKDSTDYGGVASAMTKADLIPTAGTVPTAADAATRASKVAWLLDRYCNDMVASAHRLAAVQVAIWDIMQDGGDGLAAGVGLFSSNFDNAEYSLVMAQVAGITSAYKGNAIWIEAQRTAGVAGTHVQDWGYSPVPEPVFFQMGALLGLGGMGLLRRRRR